MGTTVALTPPLEEISVSLIKRLMMAAEKLAANRSNGCESEARQRPRTRLRDSDLRQLRLVPDLLMKLKARGSKPAGDAETPKSAEYPTI